ncbi:MAG: HNH endonuclease [Succinivibrionaceae bacterium]|nr:HNH endonuclease [Succinivibrionaceae bacterium]
MSESVRKKWTREETILAFDLYCKISFGKISSTNPLVRELAEIIGRTPGSVSLKMCNLAALDPMLRQRGVSGMKHGSLLDQEVFQEFCDSWEELSYEAQKIRAEYQRASIEQINPELMLSQIPQGADRVAETKIRIGQDFFRNSVLSAYRNRCCITGIENSQLLVASHIKPWSVSDADRERTNPCNGLCLNALHDKAFDRGLITITADYRILISPRIADSGMDEKTRLWFLSYADARIMQPEKFPPDPNFIRYHNEVIFQR